MDSNPCPILKTLINKGRSGKSNVNAISSKEGLFLAIAFLASQMFDSPRIT